MRPRSSGVAEWVLFAVLTVGLSGCAGATGVLRGTLGGTSLPTDSPPAVAADAGTPVREASQPPLTPEAVTADSSDPPREQAPADQSDPVVVAQRAAPGQPPPPDVQIEEYDPLEPFNEKMFEFNRWLDRSIVKPVAKGYNAVMPETLQQMIGNGFDNIRFVPRFVNSLLQGKAEGAAREFARFLVNSTFGIGGLFDVATTEFDIRKSNEDAGQTLGVWGVGPGPYLVLPFLPPLTVRDGVGLAADMAMDPLSYVLPLFWDRFGMKVGDTINDRSLNLDLYQGFEETTVEFYSALRNAYLQRRLKLIQE